MISNGVSEMNRLKPVVLDSRFIEETLSKISLSEIEESRKRILTPLKEVILFKGEPCNARVRDINGREYIDMTAQAWTLNLGFVHPDVLYAVYVQMQRLTHVRYGFPTIPRLKLAKKLTDLAPGKLKRVSFNNEGGGLAIETAIKLALVNKPEGRSFISFWRGYHGSTLATISASNYMPFVVRFSGFGVERFVKAQYPYCYRCIYGEEYPGCSMHCLSVLEETFKKGVNEPVAGVIIEPIQGPGGQIPAPKEFLSGLRKLCNEYDASLIYDESQTAFGRIGRMFAAEYYGVYPDMMALTKALGGGFPIGALIAREDYSGFTEAEEHTTFGSNPVMMAAALINLELIKKLNLPRRAEEMGRYITKRLVEMQEKYECIGDVRGPGLFIGVELVEDRETKEPATEQAEDLVSEALKRGVIFDLSMPEITFKGDFIRNVIKFKPPLLITKEEADTALSVFEKSLKTVFETQGK